MTTNPKDPTAAKRQAERDAKPESCASPILIAHLGPLPEAAHREYVYVGHGNVDLCEWYTAAQMREREAAVIAACAARCELMAARWGDDRAIYAAHECARAIRA
jgi:hypothetical protein